MKETQELPSDFLKDIKILLAENNDLNQHLIAGLFTNWNKEIDTATTKKSALEKIEKYPYDLILIDLENFENEGEDGIDFARYLRTNMGLKSMIPIVALTTQASPDEEKRVLGSGFNDYMAVTADPNIILGKLFLALDKTDLSEPYVPLKPETSIEKQVSFDYLTELSDGDSDFVKEIVIMFLKHTPPALTSILEYNQTDDVLNLKSSVHKLKASIKVFGVTKALECIAIIEEEIHSNQSEQRRKNEVEKLNIICQDVVSELKSMEEFSDH